MHRFPCRFPVRREARQSLVFAALSVFLLIQATPSGHAQNAADAAKPHRKIVSTVEPDYPAVLKNGHFEGIVRLEVTVLANGNVSKVEVKGGNPMLAEYVSHSVLRWKYAPGPEKTIEDVTFHFNSPNR